MSTDYYCVFAGGGVRGTAYLGALKALEEENVDIVGLTGSSVGSIFSALYAVGYTFEEMKEILFNTNYEIFRDFNFPFGRDFGFCKGESFLSWLRELIEKKFYGKYHKPDKNRPVTFKDINKDLIIVATNVNRQSFKEYSRIRTPDFEIAKAVRASISIPGFFKPVRDNDECLVDGDIVVNFPIWNSASDLVVDTNARILEFRLEGSQIYRDIKNPLDYFSALFDTSYNLSTEFLVNEYGHNDQFDIVRIDTGKVQVIDFLISNGDKENLIQNGYDSVKKYFSGELVKKKKLLLWTYEKLHEYVQRLISEVSKSKIKESQLTIGDLSVFMADNKPLINQRLYAKIAKIRKAYKGSLSSIKYIGISTLKNKEFIVFKLEEISDELEYIIKEMKEFLKQDEKSEKTEKEPVAIIDKLDV